MADNWRRRDEPQVGQGGGRGRLLARDLPQVGRGDGAGRPPARDVPQKGQGDGRGRPPGKNVSQVGQGDGRRGRPARDVPQKGRGDGGGRPPARDVPQKGQGDGRERPPVRNVPQVGQGDGRGRPPGRNVPQVGQGDGRGRPPGRNVPQVGQGDGRGRPPGRNVPQVGQGDGRGRPPGRNVPQVGQGDGRGHPPARGGQRGVRGRNAPWGRGNQFLEEQPNPRYEPPREYKHRRMGYKKLQELAMKNDATEVLHTICSVREGFWDLLESSVQIQPDWMVFIIQILQQACSCRTSPELLIQCLNNTRSSKFLSKHAGSFFISLCTEPSMKQRQCMRNILPYIDICKHLLEKMPHCHQEVLISLASLDYVVNRLRKDTEMVDEEMNTALIEVMKACEEKTARNQKRARQMDLHCVNQDDLAPPDNFRDTDIFPSLEDLVIADKPFLRANKVVGAYKGLEHYLDVQFRLLREDFIQPLRAGIHDYLKQKEEGANPRRLQDLRLYHDVSILYPVCNHNGLSYRLRFDTSSMRSIRWETTRRLIFGSMVCLSQDDFRTMMFATVVNRDVKSLSEGELEVQFEHNAEAVSEISPSETFLMAETTAFFEAYRHVLFALQTVEEDMFPFKSYIIECKKDVNGPKYLETGTTLDLSPLANEKIEISHEESSSSETDTDEEVEDEEQDQRGVLARIRQGRKEKHLEKIEEQRQIMQKIPTALKEVDIARTKNWPSAESLHLDSSQLAALKTGLTKEFAIIQGPPGTGKTYLGLRIVKVLLHNRSIWKIPRPLAEDSSSCPILVVCYTNHALDQFLEGIADFQRNGIVRVGGRSKSEVLQKCMIREWRRHVRENRLIPDHARRLFYDARTEMEHLDEEMSDSLSKIDVADRGIIHEDILYQMGILSEQQYETISLGGHEDMFQNRRRKKISKMLDWLGLGTYIFEQDIHIDPVAGGNDQNQAEVEEEEVDVEEETQFMENQRINDDEEEQDKQRVGKQKAKQHLIQIQADHQLAFQLEELDDTKHKHRQQSKEVWQVTKATRRKNKQRIKLQLRKADAMDESEATGIKNILALQPNDRWRLYRLWLMEYKRTLRNAIRQRERQYQQASERMKTARDHEDMYIMQNAVVIGMTTTCAAKYHSVLQQVKPKVIIVEEAAEVLEAHITTTLSEGCEHLILIGDHQQLRPNPTVYELAEKYSLKISLFERMIKNGMNVVTLENQHRMRPEISSIMLHIYPNLKDHDSVLEYDPIRGVESSMFFIDHSHPEIGDEELKSKANDFEARYIAKLCKYLLLQDYKPSQITILTPYTGQLFQLRRYMPKKVYQGVRVCAVDNFQGEENDIILLSLVRSNSEGKLGFLSEDNRVCVLLSRAKMGFFVVGNIQMLAHKTKLWAHVAHTLKTQDNIGQGLHLYCSNHPEDKIEAREARDFDKAPEGGCLRPCGFRLDCGHACALVCHSYDKEHLQYECRKRCHRSICRQNHRCEKLCYEECGECMRLVRKVLPTCGHQQNVPCYIQPEDFSCKDRCPKVLRCGHLCQNTCGDAEHTSQCKQLVTRKLPCKHEVKMPCFQNPDEYICPDKCKKNLDCEHPCIGTCGECFNGRLHKSCAKKCDRVLVCGHLCKTACPKACPPCQEECQNRCIHSKCGKVCGIPCSPCMEPCEWRCRHKRCSKLCWEPCDRQRCNEPCHKKLKCGHRCIGMCGEKCPKYCRICDKETVEEIFFGTEEEPDARFVQLEDCGHIFEVEGMDQWMDQSEDLKDGQKVVQMIKCPRCSVVIRKNLRYGTVIKTILLDIEIIKEQLVGSTKNIKEKVKTLRAQVLQLTDDLICERLLHRLDTPNFTPEDLNVIENMICFHETLQKAKTQSTKYLSKELEKQAEVLRQINKVQMWMAVHQQRMSEQELAEARLEVTRIQLLVGAYKLRYYLKTISADALETKLKDSFFDVLTLLNRGKLTADLEEACRRILKKVEAKLPRKGLGISESERVSIVKAMGLSKGHWFKCRMGHVYAIGDCGGAAMEGKCPECGSGIGGLAHNLRHDNSLAPEMDGARFAAWSDQANMEYQN